LSGSTHVRHGRRVLHLTTYATMRKGCTGFITTDATWLKDDVDVLAPAKPRTDPSTLPLAVTAPPPQPYPFAPALNPMEQLNSLQTPRFRTRLLEHPTLTQHFPITLTPRDCLHPFHVILDDYKHSLYSTSRGHPSWRCRPTQWPDNRASFS
jgi:hypothetical protein